MDSDSVNMDTNRYLFIWSCLYTIVLQRKATIRQNGPQVTSYMYEYQANPNNKHVIPTQKEILGRTDRPRRLLK